MSFAARARRLSETSRIVVLERGHHVSYANCGLPYFVGDEIAESGDLLVQTPEKLRAALNLEIRVRHEVEHIDPVARLVRVRDQVTGQVYEQPYDALMLATGAGSILPPVPGIDLPGVQVLRTIPDAEAMRDRVESGAGHAVVVGAGFIGIEAAEQLRRRGLDVTVVELADQVLPPLDPEMAHSVEDAMHQAGIDVRKGTSLSAIESETDGRLLVTLSDGTVTAAHIVLVAAGVRPDTALAAAAGLSLGERDAVRVDEHLRTSDPAIYAAGDSIEVIDAVTGAPVVVPLAGPANRQGRAAADHLFGRGGQTPPVLGTAVVRAFGICAATTGRSEKSLRSAGIEHHAVHLHPNQHAGYYPGAQAIHLKLLFAPNGRVLGAQATGAEGIDKRIDVLATAIRAGMTVDDLAELELAYAPPFGSAKDAVNMAGFVAQNVLAGDVSFWRGADLEPMPIGTVLLDVRSPAEFAEGHLPQALNIPHTELRENLSRITPDIPLFVYCASGFRSYLATRLLRQSGWPQARSLSGGLRTLAAERPGSW
ncbi:NADH dehydrogenase [Kineosporia sp. NBRC 101731]|nr:NADH dehydrogenase [Kineosporia sp. NBRC 101731]